MAGYNDLNALIGAFQASTSSPSLRPFDLADDQYVHSRYRAPSSGSLVLLMRIPRSHREDTIDCCERYLHRLSEDRETLIRALTHVDSEKRRAHMIKQYALNKKAAISRLPNEILEEILLLSMTPLGRNIWSSPALKTCHRWRHVAEHAPRIWSCICFASGIPSECIDLWMARSAHVPLHVHCTDPLDRYGDNSLQVWQRMMEHSYRFQSLSLVLMGSWWMNHVLPINFRVDNLRELRISFPRYAHAFSPIFGTHVKASQLQTLDIAEWVGFTPIILPTSLRDQESLSLQNHLPMPSLVTGSLVELSIQYHATPDAVCEFLRECRKIQTLLWDLRSYQKNALWMFEPTSVPTLERLRIAGDLAADFLLIADLPSLRHLFVRNTCSPSDVSEAILKFTQITHLRVDVDGLDVRDLQTIYRSLPYLEHFSYPWREDTFEAILVLTGWKEVGARRIWHCPHMKQLHLNIGKAVASGVLQPDTVQYCLSQLVYVRARSGDAPLDVILDDSEATKQFAYIGVRRAHLASFPNFPDFPRRRRIWRM